MNPDYYKDEDAFLQKVEEDATTFQPIGRKIYSYSRPSGKGKSKQKVGTVNSADEDAIEYEVYYVSVYVDSIIHFLNHYFRLHGTLLGLRNITDECRFSSCCILRPVHIFKRMKTHGSSLCCESYTTWILKLEICLPAHPAMKREDEGMKTAHQCTILWGILLCTRSIVFRKE